MSRYGDDRRFRVESAKLLALLIHGMRGTPYIYQGEEIGMTNFPFEHIEQCQDIETRNMYREAVQGRGTPAHQVMVSVRAKGRDNARTPMQWSRAPQAGFTSGVPWLAVNPNHDHINVHDALEDDDSIFHFYRRLVELRKQLPVLVLGRYELLLPDSLEVYAYARTWNDEKLLVVCNLSANEVPFAAADLVGTAKLSLLLGNWNDRVVATKPAVLRPFEACLFRVDRGLVQ